MRPQIRRIVLPSVLVYGVVEFSLSFVVGCEPCCSLYICVIGYYNGALYVYKIIISSLLK